MSLYPEVQKRAQEEIDRVVGKDRLPEFKDRDSLPYVAALIDECLRWVLIHLTQLSNKQCLRRWQPVAPVGKH